MDNKIKELWTNNRVLFFILLPLIIILALVLAFRDLIFAALVGSARKVSNEARKQDEVLKTQINETAVESAKTELTAQLADKKIEERKAEDVSVDWFKKGKK